MQQPNGLYGVVPSGCTLANRSVLLCACPVIRKRVEYTTGTAVQDLVAGRHQANQFALQAPQSCDPIADLRQPVRRDLVRIPVGGERFVL